MVRTTVLSVVLVLCVPTVLLKMVLSRTDSEPNQEPAQNRPLWPPLFTMLHLVETRSLKQDVYKNYKNYWYKDKIVKYFHVQCPIESDGTLGPNSRPGTLMRPSSRNAAHPLKRDVIEHWFRNPNTWRIGTDVLGVGNPSPLNIWPKCPPHAVQVISMRCIPRVVSSCRLTAPGIAKWKKKNKRMKRNNILGH